MGKLYTALGLMSGTSGDGVDVSVIDSDGIDQFNEVTNKYFKYDQKIYKTLHYLRDKILKSNDLNINESEISNQSPQLIKLIEYLEKEGSRVIVLAAKIEEEINELENFEDRKLFLDDLGLTDSGSTILIRETHKLLNLSTFYTAGPKEVKAWTFVNGSKAPAVAGIIHSDFEKGFIRAEVVKYQDFIDYGSESKIRELGKLKIEGKDYVVEDGDIIHFRFNG